MIAPDQETACTECFCERWQLVPLAHFIRVALPVATFVGLVLGALY